MSNKEFEFICKEKNWKRMVYLERCIIDPELFAADYFRVLNHEAASGKSYNTFRAIANQVVNSTYKIVYVQSFANEISVLNDEIKIKKTAETIYERMCELDNSQSREKVGYLTYGNTKDHKAIIKQSQVIIITHAKYNNICSGQSENFIKNIDMLIIDEFPNLFNSNSFSVDEKTLVQFEGFGLLSRRKNDIHKLTSFVFKQLEYYSEKFKSEIRIVNFHNKDVQRHLELCDEIIIEAGKLGQVDCVTAARQIKELLSHTSLYANKRFEVYNSKVEYKLAKRNNIVLDANGGFDKRYLLMPELFVRDRQANVFDYSKSTIIMHPISTTKTALDNRINYILDVYNHERGKSNNGALIVSDKQRIEQLTKDQRKEIEYNNFGLAYHGNFIGENSWGHMETVYLTKTPNYRFSDYILMYLFYSREEIHGNTDCSIIQNKGEKYKSFEISKFEQFKNSIILGELYQAAKRIGRTKETMSVEINVLTQHTRVFELLTREFNGIKVVELEESDITLTEKEPAIRKKRESPVRDKQVSKVIKFVKKSKEEGVTTISKSEVCSLCEIRKDKLSSVLKDDRVIKCFDEESIEIKRNEIKIAS